MRQVYGNQAARTLREIRRLDNANDIIQAIAQLYQAEPARVKREVQRFFDDVAFDTSERAAREVGSNADPDALSDAIFSLSQEAAQTFARRMSETSLRLQYAIIEDWRSTPGATKKDLIDRIRRIWAGPRPAAAATTETTRLVAQTRAKTYQESGIQKYAIVTRNDDRVRPRHKEIASNGPYDITDANAPLPPFGDVNCRCGIRPIIED